MEPSKSITNRVMLKQARRLIAVCLAARTVIAGSDGSWRQVKDIVEARWINS